jgi:hypothetical protein
MERYQDRLIRVQLNMMVEQNPRRLEELREEFRKLLAEGEKTGELHQRPTASRMSLKYS